MKDQKNSFFLLVGILLILLVFWSIASIYTTPNKAKKVIIYELKGPIVNEKDYNVVYKNKVIRDLDYFKDHYDGIILLINSPGGDAYATKKIAEKLKEVKNKIPIVACVDEVAASGAYWLASESNYIVADDFSVVGSIGLIASYLQFSELMKKLGVKYERITFGKYKDMMSPFRNLTEEERKLIMKKLSYIYNYFVKEVAKNRNLSYSEAKKLATGEIFFGYEAINNKLIDKIGGIKECKEVMASFLNTSLDNIEFITQKGYEEEDFNLFGLSLGYGLGKSLIEFLNNLNVLK